MFFANCANCADVQIFVIIPDENSFFAKNILSSKLSVPKSAVYYNNAVYVININNNTFHLLTSHTHMH